MNKTDVETILNFYKQVFDFCDTLDETETVGAQALSDGEQTTREALTDALGSFLLYLCSANGSISEGEVFLLNLVFKLEGNADVYEEVAAGEDDPDPCSLALLGFLSADFALNHENGTKETTYSDMCIALFEAMGSLIVAMNGNEDSMQRKVEYIDGMKAVVKRNLE